MLTFVHSEGCSHRIDFISEHWEPENHSLTNVNGYKEYDVAEKSDCKTFMAEIKKYFAEIKDKNGIVPMTLKSFFWLKSRVHDRHIGQFLQEVSNDLPPHLLLSIVEGVEARAQNRQLFFADVKLDCLDFMAANLKGYSFVGLDLSGANFSGAVLIGVDFSSCNLSRVNFNGANLGNVNFSHCNLSETSLQHCDLHLAIFNGARLERTDITSAKGILASSLKQAVIMSVRDRKGANVQELNQLIGVEFHTKQEMILMSQQAQRQTQESKESPSARRCLGRKRSDAVTLIT